MLEHLIVHPRAGLTNRMRAIASAKRLCSNVRARCTVMWDWGDYHALFDDETDWIPPPEHVDLHGNVVIPGYRHIRHRPAREGGRSTNRRVPVTAHPRIVVNTAFVFGAEEEPAIGSVEAVYPWIPRPHPSIVDRANSFRETSLPSLTVGLHIRRTDNVDAILRSPDNAYLRRGDRLVDEGHHLFLATDNADTLRMMHDRYGSKLISYPKSSIMERRWPRDTSATVDVVDDIVDLLLLAGCEYVIGSAGSSFSRLAILLNGSPRCSTIDRPFARWSSRAEQIRDRTAPWLHLRSPATIEPSSVLGFAPGAIDIARSRVRNEHDNLQPLLARLLADADRAATLQPTSVMDKGRPPAGGDPHDYVSFAPYFWPDPSTIDGLPYVRRDGHVNPDHLGEHSDRVRIEQMATGAETLAVAWYLTGDERYAEQAARRLRVWFLDPATRMNPHLDFAQVIPGRTTARGFGVLDGMQLLPALDAAGMLAGSRHWSDADQERLASWINAYQHWLRSSSHGKQECVAKNNHGTYYDVQLVHIALFGGETRLAGRIAERAKRRRIAAQIMPDGSQPQELQRTESFKYSQYNIIGLCKLAARAVYAGVDLWHYQTDQGAGIRRALDFVMPFLEDPETRWPYPGTADEPGFDAVLRQASRAYGDSRYVDVLGDEAVPDIRDLLR